jgi:hypothetical protein
LIDFYENSALDFRREGKVEHSENNKEPTVDRIGALVVMELTLKLALADEELD